MPGFITTSFDLLIAAAALISCCRIQKIGNEHLPFILLIWTGLIQNFLLKPLAPAVLPSWGAMSLLALLEMLLVTWQFLKWKKSTATGRTAVLTALLLSYGLVMLLQESLPGLAKPYWIALSLLAVFAGINQLTQVLLRSSTALLKTPGFVIPLTFVVYFSFMAITCSLQLCLLPAGRAVQAQLYGVFAFIQIFGGISGCWILLVMPHRKAMLL